ncbi:MAG: hypothetical protein HYY09_00005, partial [Firmicutes bacterium]|nr:hypothetical protein [Bacillota bacterium]
MIKESPLSLPHEAVKLHPVRPGCPAMPSSAFRHRNLLGMRDLDAGAVEEILRVAALMEERNERDEREGRNGTEALNEPLLPGGVVMTLFYEASTRTRVSFELAASRLGARVVNIAAE